MIEPGDRIVDCTHRGGFVGRGRAAHHDDLDAERARRRDLAIGGVAAAVLRDDDIDLVGCHQGAIVGLAKRAARRDVGHVRQRQWRVDRIDAAEQVIVLWPIGECRDVVAAERNKDIAALLSNGAHRGTGVVNFGPSIARDGVPWWSVQHQKRHGAASRGFHCVGGNHGRIGMRGVDQSVDAFGGKICGQALGAAEAADAYRHRMRDRRGGAAGERQGHIEPAALREAFAEQARFRGAAQNEDAWHG